MSLVESIHIYTPKNRYKSEGIKQTNIVLDRQAVLKEEDNIAKNMMVNARANYFNKNNKGKQAMHH